MAQVVEIPRLKLESESEEEISVEIQVDEDPTPDNVDDANSERGTASLLATDRRSKRIRASILTLSFIILVGVSIGLAARFSSSHHDSKSVRTADGINVAFGNLGTIRGDEAENDDVTPFLDVQFLPDERALFVLSKEHWNSSFIVYPTVVKHAAPAQIGLERGRILLETTDYSFHFELSRNKRHLELVQEFHYASLQGNSVDELQQMFNDSQWPGYVTKVPIYAETDDAYYMPSDVFLSNGFFVSSYLAASEFIALKDLSESFARNTMLFVEYELSTGVVEVNYAIGLLPDEVMPQRVADDRVGYFSKRYTQYSTTDQVQRDENGYYRWDPQMTVIHRRKIELNSTTNTTKDPITYYIDPSVPKEWREAFRSGVEAWSPAFERIGLPNAIRAVVPGDSNWPSDYRLGDLRYNSISAMISEETYALGPSIIDPRSGEILHSDIVFEYGFFNQIMAALDSASVAQPQSRKHPKSSDTEPLKNITKKKSRVRTGKTRQCGYAYEEQHRLDRMLLSSFAADETGRVPKRLIAQHFASIVMHEVGHTLGLRHNFAGSSAYSHSQLRNPAFVAEHGVSSSIMDYLPANIFSDLTKDEVEKHGFFMTGIGKYDYDAIAYGYSMVDNETPGYKHPRLTEVAAAAPLFLPDEAVENMLNPFAQLFDMSSDLVGYAADRLKFVKNARSTKAMLKNLPEDTSWTALWQRERVLLRMLEQAVEIVQPLLGGVNVTHAHRSHAESSYKASFVPKGTQMKALELILRVIRAENGLFPQVEDYGSFVEVVGFNDENCDEDALDYHCLGRGLVDVGANVLYVREYAVIASLFPAMERIVQQEILSPMTLSELLSQVNKALKDQPVSYTLETFVNELLREIVNHRTTDPRIKKAVETVYPTVRASQAMEVPGDFSKRISRL